MQSFDTDADNTTEYAAENRTFAVGTTNMLTSGTCARFGLPDGNELAVFNVNGEYYATENSCPHRGAPLTDGTLNGFLVECSWHGWQFDVRTGECLTVNERIMTYPVRVEADEVIVEVG